VVIGLSLQHVFGYGFGRIRVKEFHMFVKRPLGKNLFLTNVTLELSAFVVISAVLI